MQNDLDANYPKLDIQILGVNETGQEADNDVITKGRDIPWLQDVDEDEDGHSDVWTSWDVTYRDVVILDGENVKVGTFNVTTYNLQIPENYNALRQMFIDAASGPGEIPTVSEWGLIAMTLLIFAGGWRFLSRGTTKQP